MAGRTFTATLPALPNQIYRFEWDGQDAYGRTLQGAQPVDVRVGYVFDAYYQEPGPLVRAFGHGGSGVPISLDPARMEMTFWQTWRSSIGAWDNRAAGLGGLEGLSVHHAYDPVGRVFYGGDGSRRDITSFATSIQTVAGRYPSGFSGDGGPATDAMLYRPWDVAVAPDSSLYIVDSWNHRIRRVSASGVITTVAGSLSGFGGDGGPATQARLNQPHGVALGPNGSFYIADTQNNRIRYVDATGVITTLAGTGTAGFSGDGGLAIAAQSQSSRCDRAQSRWQFVHRRYRQSARAPASAPMGSSRRSRARVSPASAAMAARRIRPN